MASSAPPAPAAPAPPAAAAKEDHLDEDIVTVPGQAYALVSFVSPESTQKHPKYGLKIRGCFASRDEAHAHVKKLQRVDGAYDVFLVDMYKWLLIPPDPNSIEDQEYQEEFLNNLISTYKQNQLDAKHVFEERKRAIMKEGLDGHLLPHERQQNPDGGEASGSGGASGSS